MAPSWIRFIVSMYFGSWRRCRPIATMRCCFLERSTAASTRRTPGASTATGFSMKTCLLAWIA